MPTPIGKRPPAPPKAGTAQAERAKRHEDRIDGVGANIRNVTGAGWGHRDFKWETQEFTNDQFVGIKVDAASRRPLAPTDFEQEIVNCYAISSYQAIAQAMPGLLDNAIKQNADGTFSVTFFTRVPIFGKTKHVETVSGDLPRQTVSATSTAEKADAWKMPLIEKAYAQWHGSYSEMEWGDPGKAMKHITGKKSKLLLPGMVSEDALFRKLSRHQNKERPMVAVTLDLSTQKAGQSAKVDLEPFTNMHAYSIVAVKEEKVDGQLQRLVTLRDPRHPEKPITVPLSKFKDAFKFIRINKARGDKFDAKDD